MAGKYDDMSMQEYINRKLDEMDAQAFFTAVMTDTLIEDGEEDEA